MGDADTTSPTPPKHSTPVPPEEDEDNSKKQKLNGAGTEQEQAPLPPPPPDIATTTPNNNEPDLGSAAASLAKEKQELQQQQSAEPTFAVQVMYNKNPIALQISPSMTVLQLKKMIQEKTGVDPNLQKVLLKGIAKDDSLLKDLGVSSTATKKILVIGSSIEDVLKVKEVPSGNSPPDDKDGKDGGGSGKDNWCSMTVHKKIVDKGVPEDVMPGILNEHDPLPPFPLHGMYSSKGSKVRLTFKLENDELWIGTKERTEKVPIGTIRNVTSQPIAGYEHYHIVAIQLGPTEASRFFVYWVPAQYVEAIKDALTGA